MTSPDLNRIAVFLKVVDEGGFTAAARALSLPKSSVSRAVALLEQELQARLLRRSSRSVAPTEAGVAFYARASRGMSLLVEAREAVVDLEAQIRGPIRITTAVDMGVWQLAPLVASFVEQHPAVMIDVVLTGRVVDLIEEGFDLALRAGPIRDESLIAKKIGPAPFALYAAPAYLEQAGRPRQIADLAKHRCVLFRARRAQEVWTLHGPAGEESVSVQGAVNTDDFSFALQVVLSGAGIGLLPSFIAERGAGKLLERVLPRYALPGEPVHLVYPANRYLPRRVSAFRDFVLQSESAPQRSKPRAR
ncbi:MAG TPA: LysR family transcriptional regulator [Polyangiaceae bacterium]|nr:LysR family transcriptional regulator [Polyangiaceae bacterium]